MTRVPIAALFVLGTAPAALAQEGGAIQATFAYKASPKWTLVTPVETWTPVGKEIAIPSGNGHGFAAVQELMTLSVDSDGDGQFDAQVKGTSGYLELHGKGKDGKPFTYAARFTSDGSKYTFASSGYMTGLLKGVQVRLIDLDNNGVYNDVGRDAIIVGGGQSASYLSKVIHINNELHSLEVSPDGATVSAKPYTGATGTLDLRSGFKSNGNLECAVVSNSDKTLSFNLAQAPKGLAVPVGSYTISGGMASKGGESVRIGPGVMAPIFVTPGETTTPAWGGAVVAEFDFTRTGEEVTVQPNIKYLGRSGEEYHTFKPDAKSPKFLIEDASKPGGKPLASGRFGGC